MNKEERGIYSIFLLLGWGIMVLLGMILILLMLEYFMTYRFLVTFFFLLVSVILAFKTFKFIKNIERFKDKK